MSVESIGKTIFYQVGKPTLAAVGASHFRLVEEHGSFLGGLTFNVRIKSNQTHQLFVLLDGSDTYWLQLWKLNKQGNAPILCHEVQGVYNDQLSEMVYSYCTDERYYSPLFKNLKGHMRDATAQIIRKLGVEITEQSEMKGIDTYEFASPSEIHFDALTDKLVSYGYFVTIGSKAGWYTVKPVSKPVYITCVKPFVKRRIYAPHMENIATAKHQNAHALYMAVYRANPRPFMEVMGTIYENGVTEGEGAELAEAIGYAGMEAAGSPVYTGAIQAVMQVLPDDAKSVLWDWLALFQRVRLLGGVTRIKVLDHWKEWIYNQEGRSDIMREMVGEVGRAVGLKAELTALRRNWPAPKLPDTVRIYGWHEGAIPTFLTELKTLLKAPEIHVLFEVLTWEE